MSQGWNELFKEAEEGPVMCATRAEMRYMGVMAREGERTQGKKDIFYAPECLETLKDHSSL